MAGNIWPWYRKNAIIIDSIRDNMYGWVGGLKFMNLTMLYSINWMNAQNICNKNSNMSYKDGKLQRNALSYFYFYFLLRLKDKLRFVPLNVMAIISSCCLSWFFLETCWPVALICRAITSILSSGTNPACPSTHVFRFFENPEYLNQNFLSMIVSQLFPKGIIETNFTILTWSILFCLL